MSSRESSVAVALLYETSAGAEHLREVLGSIGAPIVYEALADKLDHGELERSSANVVVVNLDAQNDPALDGVYDLLDDARYRVVFNEGEVSSSLSGWDRARWMRHLAAKILGTDIDPPRPANAESVPVRAAPVASVTQVVDMQAGADVAAAVTESSREELLAEVRASHVEPASVSALVDATPLPTPAPEADFDPLIDFDTLLRMPELATSPSLEVPEHDIHPMSDAAPQASDAFEFDFDVDHADVASAAPHDALHASDLHDAALSLSDASMAQTGDVVPPIHAGNASDDGLDMDFDLDFDFDVAETPVASMPGSTPESAAVAHAGAMSTEWSLEGVLDDAALPVPTGRADFGIEKMRAEEFLAPEGGDETAQEFAPALSGGLSLELIPLEEAVAPRAAETQEHENWLDPDAVVVPKAKVRKVWVLGASIGGPEAVREFLAGIPRDYPALFLLAQHLGDEFVGMMANQLTQAIKLTVRTPTHGERVAHGDVIVVPNSHRLQVDPEGIVLLERNAGVTAFSPSIDRVLQDVADRFGAGAGAIIFSGMSSDAAEGCRYLAEMGGTVYAQRPDTCVVSSMIDGVCETGVVSFLGSPQELAEKLLETKA